MALLARAAEGSEPNAKEAAVAALAMVGTVRASAAEPAPYVDIPAEHDADATIIDRTLRPGGMRA